MVYTHYREKLLSDLDNRKIVNLSENLTLLSCQGWKRILTSRSTSFKLIIGSLNLAKKKFIFTITRLDLKYLLCLL
jgi:hypothetical protein